MTSESPINRHPVPTEPALKPPKPLRLPSWRLWVPLLFQAGLIVAVPAQDAYTYYNGKPIVLQTAPVDPYDFMRGYSQTLAYQISLPDTLKTLPGGAAVAESRSGTVYVVMEAPTAPSTAAQPPQPWKPVRVSRDRPTQLPANQVALRGQFNNWRLVYGLETYYMPEDQRQQINSAINQAQGRNQQSFVVEAKVDASGNAVPISLWVRDRAYQF